MLILVLFVLSNENVVLGQADLNENDRKIIYLSYLTDEVSLNSHDIDFYFDDIVTNAISTYQDFYVKSSNPLHLHFHGDSNYYGDIYSVQLFKIAATQSPYYLLKFESRKSKCYTFMDTLWIRVSGYTLNDLQIFFDKLQEKGMILKQIQSMVLSWGKEDPMFDELDWGCLLDGYVKKETKNPCYLSQKYYKIYSACINCKDRVLGDLNSSFSKTLLLGDLNF